MAKIVLSKDAPNEVSEIVLAGRKLDVKRGASVEEESRDVLIDAETHPWLEVQYESKKAEYAFRDYRRADKDDALSAENSVAFDSDAVKRDREAVLGAQGGTSVAPETEKAPETTDASSTSPRRTENGN